MESKEQKMPQKEIIIKCQNTAKYNDCYRNIEKLGEGQYASVWKSKSKTSESGIFYASKKLTCKRDADFEVIKNEIHIMERISSAYKEKEEKDNWKYCNIILMCDYFREKNYVYIVLELLKGGELF